MKIIFCVNNKICFSNSKNLNYNRKFNNPNSAEYAEIVNDLFKKNKIEILIEGNNQANFKNFKKLFVNIEAAGGVVYNNQNKILMIKRLGKCDLPKGKVETGEALQTCAIREVEEECGISKPVIIKKLKPSYHIYKSENNSILKTTYWFLMKYNGNEELNPQKSEDITEAKWVDLNITELTIENSYANVIDLLARLKSAKV